MASASARAGRRAMGDIRSPGVAWVVHTGRMGRTVSAVVTCGDAYLGAIGPFPVSVPWSGTGITARPGTGVRPGEMPSCVPPGH